MNVPSIRSDLKALVADKNAREHCVESEETPGGATWQDVIDQRDRMAAAQRVDDKASIFRQHASELRSAAKATNNQVTRDTLLKFAEEYDRKAQHPVENEPQKFLKPMPMKRHYTASDFKV